ARREPGGRCGGAVRFRAGVCVGAGREGRGWVRAPRVGTRGLAWRGVGRERGLAVAVRRRVQLALVERQREATVLEARAIVLLRLVTVSVLGTALVVAGMLAPAPGEATGHGDVVVEPGVARPGEQVRVSMPGCRGRARVTSEVLDGRPAGGTATVKADAAPST